MKLNITTVIIIFKLIIFQFNICLTAVKKGRYTLEKRAETIKDSREYWKSNPTLPSKEPRISPPAEPPSDNAESTVIYAGSSSSRSDTSESVDSPPNSDLTIKSMLMSPPGSQFNVGTPQTDTLDIDGSPCVGSGLCGPVASNENYDQEVNFVGLCDGTEDVGLAGYIGDQQNQLHERNLVADLEFETEAPMTPTPQMCHTLSDPFADDAIPTETATLSGSMNSNLSEIHKILGTSSIGDSSGYKLAEAIDNLSKTLREHRTFFIDPEGPTASRILSGLFDQDESLEQFMRKINTPPNDLDEAITNNVNDDDALLDRVIKQTTDAYAQQNIMNRGFMAKISDFQHRHLVLKLKGPFTLSVIVNAAMSLVRSL